MVLCTKEMRNRINKIKCATDSTCGLIGDGLLPSRRTAWASAWKEDYMRAVASSCSGTCERGPSGRHV
jgi:hypothetical protein